MSVGYNTEEENQADTALSAHLSDSRNNPSLTCPTDIPFGFSEIRVLFCLSKRLTGTASKLNIRGIKYLKSPISKVHIITGIRLVRVILTDILPLSTGCTEQSH